MHFDFPTILVLATAVTGLIWAIDALLFAPKRMAAATPERPAKEPTVVEYARAFFPVILIVLLLRSFLAEPFRIPSGSMMPTLLVGDFILVNKFTYGIRLPVLNKKVVELGSPQRGDVVVFRFPREPHVDYIKRVVGLPGDRVAYYDKILYINGKAVTPKSEGIYTGVGQGLSMSGAEIRREQVGEADFQTLVRVKQPGVEGEYTVPPGHYFVMGDNRDNSNDSRFWGPVPEENLVGKAFMIWMNWDSSNGGVNFGRIGNSIN